MVICDNCLTAASDELYMLPDLDVESMKNAMTAICLNQGADIADHVCLVTDGYQERCDCACRSGH